MVRSSGGVLGPEAPLGIRPDEAHHSGPGRSGAAPRRIDASTRRLGLLSSHIRRRGDQALQTLSDRIAVVAWASRGAGRAIAAVLGEAGATVYVTGRSVRGLPTTDGLPGTIEDTADEVVARGGIGVPVRCDHTVDDDVEALFERVRAEQGRLDLLVNNAWGGYEGQPTGIPMAPYWEQPRSQWQGMFVAGLRAHLVASQFAAPLMLHGRGGLVVSTIAWADGEYLGTSSTTSPRRPSFG